MNSSQSFVLQSNELLPSFLRKAGLDSEQAAALIDRLSDTQYEFVQQQLMQIIEREVEQGRVEARDVLTGQKKQFHSVIFGGKNSQADRVVAFNFSRAVMDGILPIGGLLLAIISFQFEVENIKDASDIVSVFWDNLVQLKSPEDDDAIAILRAIGLLAMQSQDKLGPTNAQLSVATGLSPDATGQALGKLDTLRVIKNTAWGAQAGVYLQQDNRWHVRF